MIKEITAKSLLGVVKSEFIFGLSYNFNLYRGCQHDCIYCDSYSACYQIENFSDILVKINAPELLAKELAGKRRKGTIGTGSMNDPYMPIEKHYRLTRQALEIIAKYKFPVHIITKSDLVLRDIDLIKEIGKIYSAVSFTIITADDELAKKIEPFATAPSDRFKAIRELANAGIYTGVTLMPILPFINDNEENLREIVAKAKEAGAKYILPFLGLTLRDGSREHFYDYLDKNFLGLKEKYQSAFGNRYECYPSNFKALNAFLKNELKVQAIDSQMQFFKPETSKQLELF